MTSPGLGPSLRCHEGRQGTGYDKLFLAPGPFPRMGFDLHLLRFRTGTHVPRHRDPATGRHYRVNIVLRAADQGGVFSCARPLLDWPRVKIFRPDVEPHSVSRIEAGERWLLSLGVVLAQRPRTQP